MELLKNLTRDKKVEFPVQFDLKIIVERVLPDPENQRIFANLLTLHNIPHRNWRHRISGKSTYISFTVTVTVDTREKFQALYREISAVPGVKHVM